MDPEAIAQTVTLSRGVVLGFFLALLLLTIAASFLAPALKDKPAGKFLRCFSFRDNFVKIMSTKEPENANLTFLNGVRVLSVLWIVFAHGNWLRIMNVRNWVSEIDILETAGIPTILCAAYYGVDVFFWIGGFLLTIGLLEKINPKKFVPNYLMLIVHRLIRIWPTYLAAILFYWKVMPLMGDGPIFPLYSRIVNECDHGGFLYNIFFIDNFQNHGPSGQKYCFGWGWYLAVDFQLFILTPLVFLVYRRSKRVGLGLLVGLFAASLVSAWLLIFINHWRYPTYNPTFKPQPTFMDNFYYKPWIRAAPYLMGIFSGLFYLEWKEGNPKVLRLVEFMRGSVRLRVALYVVGTGLTTAVIGVLVPYQTGRVEWSNVGQAFYNSLNRVGFVLGVILVTLPCMFGCKNDPVHIVLGAKVFYPLARIQFCIYLVHLTLIMLRIGSSRALPYWENLSTLVWSIEDCVYSIFFGLLLSLLVEAPVLNLEKMLMSPPKRKDRPAKKEELLESVAEEQRPAPELTASRLE